MIKISKLTIVLIILILLGPIFDLLTGYFLDVTGLESSYNEDVLSPGVLYRGVFLIPVFLLLAHQIKSQSRLFIYYFSLVFAAGIFFRELDGQQVEIVRDGQRFLKLMLPVFGFAGMVYIGHYFTRNKHNRHYWQIGALYGAITAFGLLTTYWLGLGLRVYRNIGFASAGLIDSQNAAGLILLISLPVALYYIYKYHNNRIILVLLIEGLWLASAFRLNTRAALVGIPITILLYHAFFFLKGRYTQTKLQSVSWVILLLLTAIIGYLIVRSWSTQNIQVIIERFGLLAEGHFRNRVPFGIERIRQFTTIEHLFGVGDSGFPTVENDIVDVYGKFGLLILLPILFFTGYFYIRLIIIFLRYKRPSTFTLLLSFSFYIIHGSLAGHALLSSPVNNLFFLIYFLGYLEIKRSQSVPIPKLIPKKPSLDPAGKKESKPSLAYDT